jgi:hypothetical protein
MAAFVIPFKKQIACVVGSWLFIGVTCAYDFAGGTGEPNDPYQIATAEQLVSIGSDPNLLDKHFVLVSDIDLDPNLPGGRLFNETVIAPRQGTYVWGGAPFSGVFDGRGHSIKNLAFQRNTDWPILEFTALFGNVARGAVVSDLKVENANFQRRNGYFTAVLVAWNEGRIIRCGASGTIPGFHSVGLLAGFNRGEIIDCWAKGDVAGDHDVGGLVGCNSYGVILNSQAACEVLMGGYDIDCAGGLVGRNNHGQIINCRASGNVSTLRAILGGLVGNNSFGVIAGSFATGNVSAMYAPRGLGGLVGINGGTINDCFATGDVSGGDRSSFVGGLAGWGGFISDSYSTGRVSAGKSSKDVGGLVGGGSSSVQRSFWNIETSGQTASSGGTGLTTIQMQDPATYLAAGWDFEDEQANGAADLWLIPAAGGYPLLTAHSKEFQPRKLNGAGTPEDPFRIATAQDLDAINHNDLTASYRLEADIDLGSDVRNKPIIRYFDGAFDGAGRATAGLTIRGGDHLGLFGGLGTHARVINLGIHDANVTGSDSVGSLAAMNRGTIVACRTDGAVDGRMDFGLLTAWNDGDISDSYCVGRVSSDTSYVGGLTTWNVGRITRCYAAVRVSFPPPDPNSTLHGHPGGLVGANQEPSGSGVPFYKNLSSIPGEILDSYFLIDTDGGGPDNGFGVSLTDALMRQQTSFPGFDFESVWTICEGRDYPRLRWEGVACEP